MKKIITAFALLAITSLYSQWTTDTDANTLVAESGELDMQAKGTSNGQTYVVFWKNVGAPTNIELRMQVMDADGNQTLGADGILVSDQIPMSTSTVIMTTVVDADNKLYIGATGTGGGDPAYVFKLDIVGNQLWGTNGVNVGSGNLVTVLPLSAGGALVSWLGSSGAVMQKYDGSGNAIWPATQPISTGALFAAPANFFEVSGGEYVAVYHALIGGINSNLYAQRFDIDGNPVWAGPTQLADRTTAFIRSYKGVQDGDVVYMGYFASSGTRFDSYLQRINPDGTLPWGINGADFDTNETNYETYTEIALDPASQYIWSVCSYTDNTQGMHGEYVQKFDKTSGGRAFTDNAKVVYPIGSEKVHAGSLQLKDDNPLFLLKDGFDNGATPVTLNVTFLDENGDFGWPEETIPVATFPASKARIQFTNPVNLQYVAIFIEDKGAGPRIYAQNFVDVILASDDFSGVSFFYSNPVKDQVTIESSSEIRTISIFNVLGQQIFNNDYNGQKSINIDSQGWTSGLYFMNISTNEGVKKGVKLIKK